MPTMIEVPFNLLVIAVALVASGLGMQLRAVYQARRSVQATRRELRDVYQQMEALLACSRGIGSKLRAQEMEVRSLRGRQFRVEALATFNGSPESTPSPDLVQPAKRPAEDRLADRLQALTGAH